MDACVTEPPAASTLLPQKPHLDAGLLARFAAIVGARNAITQPADIAPYISEERGLYHGSSPLVLRPGSPDEVAAILRLAKETMTPIVPPGGKSGPGGGRGAPHA